MPTEGTTLLTSKGGAPSASSSPSLVERVKAEAATAAALLLSVLFFMACSCSMLIVNKLALNALPLPFVVLTLQMAFAVVALCCAGRDSSAHASGRCALGEHHRRTGG